MCADVARRRRLTLFSQLNAGGLVRHCSKFGLVGLKTGDPDRKDAGPATAADAADKRTRASIFKVESARSVG